MCREDKEKIIKIVRIITRLNIGGPAIHTALLTKRLDENKTRYNRYKTILIVGSTGKSEGDMSYLLYECGIEPVIIPELGREIQWQDDFIACWKIFKILYKERPDIIHTHTAKAGTLGRIAGIIYNMIQRGRGKRDKCKIIHTFHGNVFRGYFPFLKTKMIIYIEKALALFTDKIIVLSKQQLKEIKEAINHDKSKFKIIRLGFDLYPYSSVIKNACIFKKGLQLTKDSRLIVIVGRLVPIKNHEMAIEVIEQLNHICSLNDTRFIIVGDGELREKIQRLIEIKGLTGLVSIVGWQKDMPSVYADADLVVLTSKNEGTPVSLIEAMAAGCPIVSTLVGGVEDLVLPVGKDSELNNILEDRLSSLSLSGITIGENGLFVKLGDVNRMAKAIATFLEEPELLRLMSKGGRRFVLERFGVDRLVDEIDRLYFDIKSDICCQ